MRLNLKPYHYPCISFVYNTCSSVYLYKIFPYKENGFENGGYLSPPQYVKPFSTRKAVGLTFNTMSVGDLKKPGARAAAGLGGNLLDLGQTLYKKIIE